MFGRKDLLELLEYLVVIGGSVAIFFVTKATNMGVRQFTQYFCLLIVWGIVMYVALYFTHKGKPKNDP